MDQRLLFIADCLRERDSMTALCAEYGISRKTGYKWLARYHREGQEGLVEQSRRPQSSPQALSYAVQQHILALRRQYRDPPGAKKIQMLLAQRYPDQTVPSRTTIYTVLRRAGLVEPQRRIRRVPTHGTVLQSARQPNGLWSADYKGQFRLGNGQWCYPLTVMDHASRYLLACDGLQGTRLKETRAVFERLFRDYGLPDRLRTDNGTPFASTGCGGLSRLSIWWIRLGIIPERIEKGRPEQNGRHERMHRTLKRSVVVPPAASARSQQARFAAFCREYNGERPHEALQQQTPASVYRPSTRPFPERLPELVYPSHMSMHRVSSGGIVYALGRRIYVGYLLIGEIIGLEAINSGIWAVHFGPVRLGRFDERDARGDYLTLKV
jgi:transposase InsO family protein